MRASKSNPKSSQVNQLPPEEPHDVRPNGHDDFDQSDLPSTDPGDLGDFARFAISRDSGLLADQAVVCLVGRPSNITFFRTPTDALLYRVFNILEFDSGGGSKRQYIVAPDLCGLPELKDRTSRKQLVPYITLDGALGLWPISARDDDNSWVKSAFKIVLEAQTRWVAAISSRTNGAYRVLPAETPHPEPVWPLRTIAEWLNLAFPAERQIVDRDHPVVVKLRG